MNVLEVILIINVTKTIWFIVNTSFTNRKYNVVLYSDKLG